MTDEKTIKTEVLIVGGGPAGMAAALWCADLGMKAVLLEKESRLGGQLHRIFNPIENYLGLSCANGSEMLELFEGSLVNRTFNRVFGADARAVDVESKTISLADGRRFSADAIIVASGVRRRKLDIPGEAEFRGKGILNSGSGERSSVAGKSVMIVGGGDAAAENALILAEHAERVFLVHRRETLSARGEFSSEIEDNPKIEKLLGYTVESIGGRENVEFAVLRNNAEDKVQKVPIEHVLIRIGVEPNNDFLTGLVDLDSRGYIIVDRNGQTSLPAVFAAGDIATPISPTISTAVGTASTVAKAVHALLKGSNAV